MSLEEREERITKEGKTWRKGCFKLRMENTIIQVDMLRAGIIS